MAIYNIYTKLICRKGENMTKIQEIRKQNGLTQEEISNKLGISQQSYANYEKDNASIPDKMLNKIANILMVDKDTLLYEEEMSEDSISEFLYKSLTSFHAVKNTIWLLEKAGFKKLSLDQYWSLAKGDKYYVTINNSGIIAFKINDNKNYVFNIASCHTDSPSLKVKGNNLIKSAEGYKIDVEKYGGLINYSFMDIPLKIAGRVFVEKENGLEEKIISSSFNVNIPSLCIHHNPNVNSGMELSYQNDMLPLLGEASNLYEKLLPKEKIVNGDLYCVPFVKPAFVGSDNERLVSPRIDNLSSLYSITQSLIAEEGMGISILYATDNEEVGSLSKQGAESMFLSYVLTKINKGLNKSEEDFYSAITNGFVLSIDNGHAVHQAHPEKNDPVAMCTLNNGVVIKHHPNYATDGYSSSVVEMIAKKAGVNVQHYYNQSDLRCGSTIGLVTSAQLAIDTCDIGLAQLAMHSAIETVGKKDILEMQKLVKAFYESERMKKDNLTVIK